jgi:hypothetical protein
MSWRQQWLDFRQQLRINLRLRVGVVLVGILPLVYGALVLRDAQEESFRKFQIAANHLMLLKKQSGQNEWAERQKSTAILKAEMESRLWKSPTPTLARAAFQDWLNAQISQSGVSNVLLVMEGSTLNSDSEAESGLVRVAAKLNFMYTRASMNVFLQRLVDAQPHVAIETLNIAMEPAPRVEMIVAIYVAQEDAP